MCKSPSRLPTSRRAGRKTLSPQPSSGAHQQQPTASAQEHDEYTFDPEAVIDLSQDDTFFGDPGDLIETETILDVAGVLTLIAAGVSKIFIKIGDHAALYEQGDLRNSLECFGHASIQTLDHMLRKGWLRYEGIFLRVTEAGQRAAFGHVQKANA